MRVTRLFDTRVLMDYIVATTIGHLTVSSMGLYFFPLKLVSICCVSRSHHNAALPGLGDLEKASCPLSKLQGKKHSNKYLTEFSSRKDELTYEKVF